MCGVSHIKPHASHAQIGDLHMKSKYSCKNALVILGLSAMTFFLGFIAGENTSTLHEEITGTYVSGFVTLSIDAGQESFYYYDTQNKVFSTGNAELLSTNCCKLEAASEIIPQQIVANSHGVLYCFINGNICAMKKAYDIVIRLDVTGW